MKRPDLTLRFKKKHDGDVSLTYTRADGTSTGQRGKGSFFAYHDLGHYAVETTLGLRSAFLGMLARGWDLQDFGTPWPKGRFPEDAIEDLSLGEGLAGLLDAERRTGQPFPPSTLNDYLGGKGVEMQGSPFSITRVVTEEEMARVRAAASVLIARWKALPAGESLELVFPAE